MDTQKHRHRTCYSCNATNKTTKQFEDLKIKNKSKNVLDIRIVPGHPNGAWVECYKNTYDIDAQAGIAEKNAEWLCKNHHQIRQEKTEKLKHFQEEVSKRVSCLQQLKKKQLKLQTIQNMEEEQNVVIQRTLGLKLPYRGTMEDLQALNKELLKSCIIPCSTNKQLIRSEVEKSNELLQNTCVEVQSQISKARKNLLAKKLEGNDYTVDLPGGSWSPHSKKKTITDVTPKVYPSNPPVFNQPIADTWTGIDEIKPLVNKQSDHFEKDKKDEAGETDVGEQEEGGTSMEPTNSLNNMANINEAITDEIHEKDANAVNLVSTDQDELINVLQRNLIYDWCNQKQQETEHGKNKKKMQYWKYRKIFMDIERDQVQERKRKEEHRKRIIKLKIKKEREREVREEKLTEFPETIIPSTQTRGKAELQITIPTASSMQSVEDETSDKRKEKEIYRYIEALRAVAKERLQFCNISVPPLCQCGPTLWDSHPDTCANNCMFYKNPKAYVKALSKVLSSNR